MYRTQCVLSLLLLCAGLAHTFDWDIVIYKERGLQFYDVKGSLMHSETIPLLTSVNDLAYDPVHNRVLFSDHTNIRSFDISSKTFDTLVRNTNKYVSALDYDPTTELVFWSEGIKNCYLMSLKPGLNSSVSGKSLIYEGTVVDVTVDICGGFIYWISEDYNIMRARFDGSGRETVIDTLTSRFLKIDHETQKIYWYRAGSKFGWIKHADLNGMNIREVQIPKHETTWTHLTTHQLAFSKEHLYLGDCEIRIRMSQAFRNCTIWKIPKNAPSNEDVLVDSNIFIKSINNLSKNSMWSIAAKYNIEDVTRGVHNCDRLKSLLPNYSSLLSVHGGKVGEECRCECEQGLQRREK